MLNFQQGLSLSGYFPRVTTGGGGAAPELDVVARNGGVLFLVQGNEARCFQNYDGTVPASAVGSPLGYVGAHTGAGAATQAVSGARPTVGANAQGSKTIQFAGSGQHLVTGISSGREGWVCAGVTFSSSDTQCVLSTGAGSETERGIMLALINAAYPRMFAQLGNGVAKMQANMQVPVGSPTVISMGWTSVGVFAGVDSAESAVVAVAGDVNGPKPMSVGAYHDGVALPFTGPMTALVYTPVVPSPADRAEIRAFIGALQGQTF